MAYRSKLKRENIDALFEAILSLHDQEDCYRFFEDLTTINDLHAMAQRRQGANLLAENCEYKKVEEPTGASTATISRINKCLLYGADGYRRVLDRQK